MLVSSLCVKFVYVSHTQQVRQVEARHATPGRRSASACTNRNPIRRTCAESWSETSVENPEVATPGPTSKGLHVKATRDKERKAEEAYRMKARVMLAKEI